MKTARFTEVVSRSGAPEIHQLWVPPQQDRAFQSAIKEQRILTIHQENTGAKKDYGRVGFHEEPLAQYLVFPKSLRRFADRRIIGINYGLLKRAPTESAQAPAAVRKRATKGPTDGRERARTGPRAARGPEPAGTARAVAASAATLPSAKRAAERRSPAPATGSDVAVPPMDTSAARSKGTGRSASAARTAREARGRAAAPTRHTAPPHAPTAAADRKLLAEVKRAVKELKAGKTVAAYERLDSLVASADRRVGRSSA